MYRGWTQTDYQNKHYNINQKDEGTYDDRGRDGGTNFILRIKEQETRLTLQEHDGDDEERLFQNKGAGLGPTCDVTSRDDCRCTGLKAGGADTDRSRLCDLCWKVPPVFFWTP